MPVNNDIKLKIDAALKALEALTTGIQQSEKRVLDLPNQTHAAEKLHNVRVSELKEKEAVLEAHVAELSLRADTVLKHAEKKLADAEMQKQKADALLSDVQKQQTTVMGLNAEMQKQKAAVEAREQLVEERVKKLDELKASL